MSYELYKNTHGWTSRLCWRTWFLLLGSSGGSLTANKERPEEESSGRPATSLLMFCLFRFDAVTANNQNNNSSTALLMEWRNNSTTETELDSFMTGVLQLDCLIQCFQFIKMFSVNQLVTIRRISTGFLFCLKILLTHAGDWFSSCRLLFFLPVAILHTMSRSNYMWPNFFSNSTTSAGKTLKTRNCNQ